MMTQQTQNKKAHTERELQEGEGKNNTRNISMKICNRAYFIAFILAYIFLKIKRNLKFGDKKFLANLVLPLLSPDFF